MLLSHWSSGVEHKLLNTISPHGVAEMRVAELGSPTRFCCSLTRRRTSIAMRTAHSRSPSGTESSPLGYSNFDEPLTVLLIAFVSRPDSAPPKKTRFCSSLTRLWFRSWLQHSDRKSLGQDRSGR